MNYEEMSDLEIDFLVSAEKWKERCLSLNNWNEVECADAYNFWYLNEEITQLEKDKAELIEALKNMTRIVENRPDGHYLEAFEKDEFKDAESLLDIHEQQRG